MSTNFLYKVRLQKEVMKSQKDTRRCLFQACMNDDDKRLSELMDGLVDIRMDVYHFNNTLLHIACGNGSVKCTNILLTQAPYLCRIKNIMGNYPLHQACTCGSNSCVTAILNSEYGKQVINHTGQDYRTALHISVLYNYISIVKNLLEKGASLEVRDALGRTPIHLMVSVECAKVLLSKEVDVNSKDCYGSTFLHRNCANGNYAFVKLLLAHGADPNMKDNLDRTALHIACCHSNQQCIDVLLLNIYVDVNAVDIYGWAPIHIAVRLKNFLATSSLLRKGAWPNIEDYMLRTPLHFACTTSHFVHTLLVSLLLSYGGEIETKTKDGQTALHLACSGVDDNQSIPMLLEKGASLLTKDTYLTTPFHLAVKSQNLVTVLKLLNWAYYRSYTVPSYFLPLTKRVEDIGTSRSLITLFESDIPRNQPLEDVLHCRDIGGKNPLQTACKCTSEFPYHMSTVVLLYDTSNEDVKDYHYIETLIENNTNEPPRGIKAYQWRLFLQRRLKFSSWKRQVAFAIVLGKNHATRNQVVSPRSIPLIFAIDLIRDLIHSYL